MKAGGTPKFKYKRVKIIWQDIVTDASWFDSLQDVDKLNFQWCEDIGYLYSKDTKTVKIFTSFNYDGDKLSEHNLLASQSINKKNIISRILKSINYLIWGDV